MKNVLKYIWQRKGSNNELKEEPIYFGAEQRFVDPLLNTNLRNLEEQNIFGMDYVLTTYERNNDNGTISSISECDYYHKSDKYNSKPDKFYRIESDKTSLPTAQVFSYGEESENGIKSGYIKLFQNSVDFDETDNSIILKNHEAGYITFKSEDDGIIEIQIGEVDVTTKKLYIVDNTSGSEQKHQIAEQTISVNNEDNKEVIIVANFTKPEDFSS